MFFPFPTFLDFLDPVTWNLAKMILIREGEGERREILGKGFSYYGFFGSFLTEVSVVYVKLNSRRGRLKLKIFFSYIVHDFFSNYFDDMRVMKNIG